MKKLEGGCLFWEVFVFVVYLFLILGFRIAWYNILMMLKHLPVLNGEYM